MTTTTGDSSTLKTPASLSSGDLVSRLLAATPPYLYNMPLTSHSFFFSEMLRSFVQPKSDALSLGASPNVSTRRRKRSWKEAGPLELTTAEKRSRHHHHHHHHHHPHQPHHQQQPDKYFHNLQHSQAQQPCPQDNLADNQGKVHEGYEEKSVIGAALEQKAPEVVSEVLKGDESYADFKQKNYFADRIPQTEQLEAQKPKSEEMERKNLYNERSGEPILIPGQKNKPDLSACNFLSNLPSGKSEDLQAVKGFPLPGNVQNPDFLPGPLWYPPYPMSQSYPGIDPLHFFIDLRVSGHIWDQKLGSEKQQPFKSKHSSAFSVPQSKECNRPLNLTRNEAGTSKSPDENTRGTHYILKHISRTYQDIHDTEKISKTDISELPEDKSCEDDGSLKKEESSSSQEEERKDIRAIIGLELVVDYVKEPKCDPGHDHPSTVTE